MRHPKVSTNILIDLLAEGNTVRQVCTLTESKKYSIERQLERLRQKHNCKNTTALVVKLKLNGIITSKAQSDIG